MATIQAKKIFKKGLKKGEKNLKSKPKIIAKLKLAAGPAKATKPISLFGFFRSKGLKGTGFAQPKTKLPLLTKKRKRGKRKEPKGSKCFKGFKDNLPLSLAVGSPSL